MHKMDIEKIKEYVITSYSFNELSRKYFNFTNSKKIKQLKNYIQVNNINIIHFDNRKYQRKYKIEEKECPVCLKKFTVRWGAPREKKTCSHKCANTYFRSGEDNGQYKNGETIYRKICFKFHEHKCLICDEKNVLDVHHVDKNTENNSKENLIPLCPTHHRYLHSKYANMVSGKIKLALINLVALNDCCIDHENSNGGMLHVDA